jgi:hypothetical protein
MENSNKQPSVSEEEGLALQKEIFMTSGGLKVGQTMEEYRAEREALWAKMHPEKKETVETETIGAEPVLDNKEVGEEYERKVKASEAKRQEDLKRVRQELGLDTSPEKPKINYIEVVIDDDFMRKNLMPDGGLRMKSGQANWQGEVNLMKYVIAEDLSPEYRQIAIDKIKKLEAGQERTYKHESHHIQNRENELAPHVAAKSLREYLSFRVLDEMSAFATGELDNQEMTAENILQALLVAEKNITDSYYGEPFSGDANWYMSQHGNEPEALARKINPDRYHRVMRQYFKINGQDALSVLQKDNRMPEFTEITNRLILKLDSLLDTAKASSDLKGDESIESPSKTEKVENKKNIQETKSTEGYMGLPNVVKAREQLLTSLTSGKEVKDSARAILYEMLTRRSEYVRDIEGAPGGGLEYMKKNEAQRKWYDKTLKEIAEQIDQGGKYKWDSVLGWFGINTRPEVPRREGINLKAYATIPITEQTFIQHLPKLADKLRELAEESDDIIKVKVPEGLMGFVSHNDSIVIHFKKAENKERILAILSEWTQENGISKSEREMGRAEIAADSKDDSFSNLVAKNIAKWLDENKGKYQAELLAELAVKYAIERSQKSPVL